MPDDQIKISNQNIKSKYQIKISNQNIKSKSQIKFQIKYQEIK